MVKESDIHHGRGLLRLSCDLQIRLAWAQISRGMIVSQDQPYGTDLQGFFKDDSDIHKGPGQPSFAELKPVLDVVGIVQVEHPELLMRQAGK